MSEIGVDVIVFIGIAAKSTAWFLWLDWKCLVYNMIVFNVVLYVYVRRGAMHYIDEGGQTLTNGWVTM